MFQVISVLGSTGNQGSATVRALCQLAVGNNIKLQINAITRNIQNATNKLKNLLNEYDDKIKLIQADYTNKQSMMTALQKSSAVFVNFANLNGVKEEIVYAENIVDAAVANNIKYIIWSGNNAEFETSLFSTKKEMEKYLIQNCEENNINYTILKPCTFMQNFLHFHQINFMQNECTFFWDKDLPICWISTDDIGYVAARLFLKEFDETNKEVYIYGDIKTMDECMHIFSKALKRKLVYTQIDLDIQNKMIMNENVMLRNVILMCQQFNQNKYDLMKNRKLFVQRIKQTKDICADLMDFETFVNANIHLFLANIPKHVNIKSKM